MPSLFILIPIAMIFCALAIWAFFWALDNEQYKDMEKEASRILFDEDDDTGRNKSDKDRQGNA